MVTDVDGKSDGPTDHMTLIRAADPRLDPVPTVGRLLRSIQGLPKRAMPCTVRDCRIQLGG